MRTQCSPQDPPFVERLASVHRLDWWAFGILALLTFLTYLPSLRAGLLSDDWGLVYPRYDPWVAWHGHWFGGGEGTYYRPLSRLLIYYTAAIFGTSGAASHLISIALHIGCGAFLFSAMKRLGRPVAGLIAATTALLHPAAVETVGWVASQTDLLVMIFFLGSLRAALGPMDTKHYMLTGGFAVLAYLSKDTSLLLGPTILISAGYVLLLVRPLPAPRRNILILAGLHAGLWIAYLFARRVFLGAFLYETGDNSLAQMTANLMAAVNEFLWPIGELFGNRGFLHKETIPFFAGMLALPVLFFWCAASRRHLAAIAIALMCLGLGPYMKALDVTTWTGGGERFFYHPLWFFAVLCGLLAEPAIRLLWEKRALLALGTGLILLLVRMTFLTGMELDDFRRAALVRDQIESELVKSVFQSAHPIIVVERYPDRIGGAFVFRNGFPDFVNLRSDREIQVMMVSELTAEHLKPGMQVFRFNFRDEGKAPILEFDSVMTRLATAPVADQQGQARPAPLVFDFADPAMRRMRFSLSADMTFEAPNSDGSFQFRITGSDPNIGLPLPQSLDHRSYRTAFIEFALPDAHQDVHSSDTIEALFVPAKEHAAAVTLSRTMRLQPGRQRIEFDLHASLAWRAAPGLTWFRFDPGSQYLGRIDVYRMGLE